MALIYILSGVLLLSLAFIIFRVIVRNEYLKKGKLSFVSYTLELFIFTLHANFMYIYIPVRWPELPHFPEDVILNLVIKTLLSMGLLIVFTAMFHLGFESTLGRDNKVLKTKGLYKYSRNPQIIGYSLFLIAFGLCYLSLYALGWFIMFIVLSILMIMTEEEFLRKNYAEEYANYCKKVPRIIKLF